MHFVTFTGLSASQVQDLDHSLMALIIATEDLHQSFRARLTAESCFSFRAEKSCGT
jgi:hypothetical protein